MQARFHGLTFITDPGRVFSPRRTTEQLVDAALERIGDAPARVADIGTGSGVIAVTLALRAPLVEVWASDTCARALEIAAANAERLGAQVHLVRGDLLEGLPRDLDLIVANLPYLAPGSPGYDGEPRGGGLLDRRRARPLPAAARRCRRPPGGRGRCADPVRRHGARGRAERAALAPRPARVARRGLGSPTRRGGARHGRFGSWRATTGGSASS